VKNKPSGVRRRGFSPAACYRHRKRSGRWRPAVNSKNRSQNKCLICGPYPEKSSSTADCPRERCRRARPGSAGVSPAFKITGRRPGPILEAWREARRGCGAHRRPGPGCFSRVLRLAGPHFPRPRWPAWSSAARTLPRFLRPPPERAGLRPIHLNAGETPALPGRALRGSWCNRSRG